MCLMDLVFFFFKQKTAYEMRISDWSSDVCSSDLGNPRTVVVQGPLNPGMSGGPAFDSEGRVAGIVHAMYLVHLGGMSVSPNGMSAIVQIGRASCRERVCQYV